MVARAFVVMDHVARFARQGHVPYDEPGTTMSLIMNHMRSCAKVKLCPARRATASGPPILREKKLPLARDT